MRIRHPRISATNQAINHQGYPLNEVGKDEVCHSPIREGDDSLFMSHMIQRRGRDSASRTPAAISIVLFFASERSCFLRARTPRNFEGYFCHAFLTCLAFPPPHLISPHPPTTVRTYQGDIALEPRGGSGLVAYRRQIRQKGSCRLLVCRCGSGGPWCLHVRAGVSQAPVAVPMVPRFHSLGSNGSVPVTNALSTCGSARLGACALQLNSRIPLSPRRWECSVELWEFVSVGNVMVS